MPSDQLLSVGIFANKKMVETAEGQDVGLKEFFEIRKYMGSGNRMSYGCE